jgi:hypothetical protein
VPEPSIGACIIESYNDLSNDALESISLDDGDHYQISGEPIALGEGGIEVSPESSPPSISLSEIYLPISLEADQAWNVLGGGVGTYDGLYLGGPITGSAHKVTVKLSNAGAVALGADAETGPITIAGSDPTEAPSLNGSFSIYPGGALNASDGNPVNVEHAFFLGTGTVGPIRSTGSDFYIGTGESPAGSLAAASITFDRQTSLAIEIAGSGETAGVDYSQIDSTGPVTLGNATIALRTPEPCPELALGTKYTLVSTTGELTGQFANAPAGGEVAISPSASCERPQRMMRISYNEASQPQTITGTITAPTSSTALEVIPSLAVTNQQITIIATVTPSVGDVLGTVQFADQNGLIPACASQPVVQHELTYTAICKVALSAEDSPAHITATFQPASELDLQASAASTEVVIDAAATTTTVMAPPTAQQGTTLSYIASVSPEDAGIRTPTGVVEFMSGNQPVPSCAAQPVSSLAWYGTATCAIPALPNAQILSARYLGDVNFRESVSAGQRVSVESPNSGVLAISEIKAPASATAPKDHGASPVGRRLPVRDGRIVVVKLLCAGHASCAGKLAIRTRAARGVPAGILLGRATYAILGEGSRSIRMTITPAGRRLLSLLRHRILGTLVLVEGQASTESKSDAVFLEPATMKLLEKHR